MMHSRRSTRAYIKAFALCSLSLGTLPLSTAQTATSTEACEASDGDKSFGVQVVNDVGCANGGLGCYDDHCRYCKVIDTPKSSQFESCSSFGASFSSMASPTATTGPCEISEGDARVGIAAVSDEDCLYGGLGCYNGHCRFCKRNETPESIAFIDCTSLNATTIITHGTLRTPASSVVRTRAPTNGSACSFAVTEGDAAVGINIVTDSSCMEGGIGCIDEVCRYCRVMTTVQSAAFTDCRTVAGATVGVAATPTAPATEAPIIGSTCQQVATEEDIKAGITVVPDTSCATGGIGCTSDMCRYCRLVYTQQSAAFVDCRSISDPKAELPSDVASTSLPATSTVNEVPTGSPTGGPANERACTQIVSSGDASVGINIVSDSSCASGGVGCIDASCRFCKVFDSNQSSPFTDCTSLSNYFSGSGYGSEAPTEGPSLVEVPSLTGAPSTVSTDTPTEAPLLTDTFSTSSAICAQNQSEGDAAVGINIITDTSCASGGVGCIDGICRFCKVIFTEQSAAFVDCPVQMS